MKKKITNDIVLGFFLTVLLLLTALVCLPINRETGNAADYHKVIFEEKKYYYSNAEELTYEIFVQKTLEDATVDYAVTYQKVKVDACDKGNVVVKKGKADGTQFEVLEEKTVEKSEITRTEYDSYEKYYSFEVKTNVNCAWIFTIQYKNSQDDDWAYEYPSNSDVLYCTNIDTYVPKMAITSSTLVAGGYKYSLRASDLDEKSAVSGIRTVRIFQQKTNETEPTLFYEKAVKATYWTDNIMLPAGKVTYTYEVVDYVGNRSSGELVTFTDEVYDKTAETEIAQALEELDRNTYASSIRNKLNTAHTEYMMVTRNDDSTEAEKQEALRKLNEALSLFAAAKQARENLTSNFVATVVGNNEGITVSGEQQALSFLPIGESANITVTVEKTTQKKAIKGDAEAKEAGIEEPTERYTFNLLVTSRDSGVDFMVSRTFDKPLKIKVAIGEYEKIAAVQKVYSQNGNVTYYECLVTEYVDGTVNVETPYAGGIVYLYVKKSAKKMYWLFSLTAVPLIAGGILILWANKKMKKVKEEALKAKEAEKNDLQPEKKKPVKNKKKK